MPINTKLQTLTQDLYYMSESDYPWVVEEVPAALENVKEILASICTQKGWDYTKMEERTLANFFARLVEIYPGMPEEEQAIAERYAALNAFLLAQNLQQSAVFRVGESVKIEILVLAITQNCDCIALTTTAIET